MSFCDSDKIIVCGYIRKVYKLLIPHELIELCILYYVIKETLKINSHYERKSQSEIIGTNSDIFINRTGIFTWNIIGDITLKTGKHHWRFEILKIGNELHDYDIQFGIQNKKDADLKMPHTFNTYLAAFTFINKPLREMQHNPIVAKLEVGDIIDMYLDLDGINKDSKGILSFAVNNVQRGIARDDIDCNHEYQMFIHSSADVQLLFYRHTGVLPKECYLKSNGKE